MSADLQHYSPDDVPLLESDVRLRGVLEFESLLDHDLEVRFGDGAAQSLEFFGAYLGVTAVLEGIGQLGLVWPAYIADPNVGITPERARGPFVASDANGLALYSARPCDKRTPVFEKDRANIHLDRVEAI